MGGLAHQNRTIAIASDFRVDGAKSPEISQKEGVLGSKIAARNRKSLATFHRTLKSQCSIAVSSLGNRAISGVRDGHRNRKSQKSLRFRCAKMGGHHESVRYSASCCTTLLKFLTKFCVSCQIRRSLEKNVGILHHQMKSWGSSRGLCCMGPEQGFAQSSFCHAGPFRTTP